MGLKSILKETLKNFDKTKNTQYFSPITVCKNYLNKGCIKNKATQWLINKAIENNEATEYLTEIKETEKYIQKCKNKLSEIYSKGYLSWINEDGLKRHGVLEARLKTTKLNPA